MAVMQSRDNRSYNAGADLSSEQFKFVKLGAGTVTRASTLGENCLGILLNNPTSGNAATVCVSGKVMIKVGAVAVAAGAKLCTDANGLAKTAASSHIIMGYANEAGAAGQIIAMELIQGGNAA
jgi:hypothetical protein